MRLTGTGLVGLLAAGLIVNAAARAEPPGPWRFVEHTIATDIAGAYQVVPVDLNRDKRLDLLVVAPALGDLVWFENPGWQRHTMASGIPGMINASAFDVDRDGIPEIALASGFSTAPAKSSGIVSLLTHREDTSAPWVVREIDRVPTSHRVRWIDADGTGRRVLVNAPLAGPGGEAPDYRDRVPVTFYEQDDWSRGVVTEDEKGVVHGLSVTDWDGTGREAVLTASFLGVHLHRYENGRWQRVRLVPGDLAAWPKSGASEASVGHTNGERFLTTIEPWHGHQVVVYREFEGRWRRSVIDDTLVSGHTLSTIDLDGDGADEILAGQRGAGGRVVVYRHASGGTWEPLVIDDQGIAASSCAAADLNNDERPDVVCVGSATANLKWYENQSAGTAR